MEDKELLINNIMLEMSHHLDGKNRDILYQCLLKNLVDVNVSTPITSVATCNNTNEYIMEIWELRRGCKLSKHTVAQYKRSMWKLIDTVHKSILEIKQTDVEYYLHTLQKQNMSGVGLNNQLKNISSIYTWLRKTKILLENPCEGIDMYPEVTKPIDHLEPEEVEQLKTGCKNPIDRPLIEYLRSTACRAGELPPVNICDVDWRSGHIMVYGFKNKSWRTVCLDSVAKKYLLDYIYGRGLNEHSDQPLFVNRNNVRVSVSNIEGMISKIGKRAGLSRPVYPHIFRKTTATNIVKRGGTISDAGQYLGHKDTSTAGKHYAYMSENERIRIFELYVATP